MAPCGACNGRCRSRDGVGLCGGGDSGGGGGQCCRCSAACLPCSPWCCCTADQHLMCLGRAEQTACRAHRSHSPRGAQHSSSRPGGRS